MTVQGNFLIIPDDSLVVSLSLSSRSDSILSIKGCISLGSLTITEDLLLGAAKYFFSRFPDKFPDSFQLLLFCCDVLLLINKPPCSKGQRNNQSLYIVFLIHTSIITINTHFYHKESKGTFKIANKMTNYLLYLIN